MAETNPYKYTTDAFRQLYLSFIESGFTEDEAFTLTTFYVRQSTVENLMREERENRIRAARRESMKRTIDKEKLDE